MLFDSVFEKDKLELERKIILNEAAEASDDPRDKIQSALIKCLFKHHPIRNPVLGSRKTVNQISFEDIEKARQTRYAPQNMILILTGKFSDNDVEEVIHDFQYRENGNSVARSRKRVQEGKPRKQVVIERSGITQAYLSFGFRTVPARDVDVSALDLIEVILGIGESSRLFVELREKRALTYDFEALHVVGLDYGCFSINCAVKTESIEQTGIIIKDELEKLKTNFVTKGELEKSKNLILGEILRSMDSPQEVSIVMSDMEIHFQNEKALIDYKDKMSAVSEREILEVANKYFQDNNYSTAVLRSKK